MGLGAVGDPPRPGVGGDAGPGAVGGHMPAAVGAETGLGAVGDPPRPEFGGASGLGVADGRKPEETGLGVVDGHNCPAFGGEAGLGVVDSQNPEVSSSYLRPPSPRRRPSPLCQPTCQLVFSKRKRVEGLGGLFDRQRSIPGVNKDLHSPCSRSSELQVSVSQRVNALCMIGRGR